MNKIRLYLFGFFISAIFLSGCGVADEKKLSEDTSVTQQPSAASTVTPGADSAENEKLYFTAYAEKYPERLTDAKDWKTADGKYHNPLTEQDVSLGKMGSWEERYAACQIPKEIVDEADTAALLELVLESPMLDDMLSYCDSYVEGIKQYAEYNNGMYELQKREDYYKTVVTYYNSLEIPAKIQNDLDKVLPDNPTKDDYSAAAKDDEQMKKVYEDIKVKNKINFCVSVIAAMTEDIQNEELEHAGKVLSDKFSEIEASEYNDMGVLKREDLQDASWVDQTVMKAIVQSGK